MTSSLEDKYFELVEQFKRHFKRFTSLKKEQVSCSSIYENILREK